MTSPRRIFLPGSWRETSVAAASDTCSSQQTSNYSSLSWPKTGTLMAHLNSVISPSPNCLPSTPLWGATSKPNRFLCCLSSCLVRESGTTVQCCKKCWEYFLRLQQSEASLWTLNKLSGRSLESCCPTCHCRDVCFTGRKRCGER